MADDAVDYIYQVADANAALQQSFNGLNDELIRNINKSKTWTIVSRLTSGSGFWKIQNKLRAVTNAWVLYNDTQAEAIKKSAEMGEALGKYNKLIAKIPERGFSMYTEAGDTEDIIKQRDAILSSDEFKDMEAFNKRKFQRQGLEGADADTAAQEETLKYYEEQISIQQDMVDTQLDAILHAEEMAAKNPIFRYADKIVTVVKTLPRFLLGGLKIIKKALIGMAIATLLLPIVFKVFRWLLKVASTGNNIERLKVAWGFIKEAMMGMIQLAQAIFKGQIGKAFGIYLKKVLFPLANLVIFAVVQLVKVFIVKPVERFLGWILSDAPMKRLEEVIGNAFRKIQSGVGGFVSGFLGVDRRRVKANEYYATSASGNFFPGGGMSIVGEGGPELVSLPRGARVHSNFASRGMMRGMGNNIHVHVNGRVGASDSEIRDIAQKVAREINLQMNRSSSTVARM